MSGATEIHIGKARILLLPTIHWHPAGAVDALRCLYRTRPGCVLVELPDGIEKRVEEGLQRLLPESLGFAIELPFAQLRCDGRKEAIVMTATDSLTHAVRWAIRHGIPWQGIDLLVAGQERLPGEGQPGPDPWWLLAEPQAYWSAVRALRTEPSPTDALREEHMAWRIRQVARNHSGPIAVILGAAHADALAQWLTGNRKPRPQPAATLGARPFLARLGGTAWIVRYLGPLPAVGRFLLEIADNAAILESFCPREYVERLVREALEQYRYIHHRLPGLNQWQNFWRLAAKAVVTEGRRIPGAVELIRAARGAADDDFAQAVARCCLGHWQGSAGILEGYPVLELPGPGAGGSTDLQEDIPIYVRDARPTRGDGLDELADWAGKICHMPGRPWRPIRSGWEPERLPRCRWASCLTDKSWQHALQLTQQARQLASDAAMRPVAWHGGNLGELDIHEMIRAASRGRRQIYRRVVVDRIHQPDDERNDFHPVVWVFEDDPNANYYCTGYIVRLGPENVYHPIPAVLDSDRCTDNIRYLVALVALCPWWYVRYAPGHYTLLPWWLESRGYSVPRQDPWTLDVEVPTVRPYEHLIALAIQFARRQVIVVSDTGHRTTLALQAKARKHNVRVVEIKLNRFASAAVDQLRRFEFGSRWVEDPY